MRRSNPRGRAENRPPPVYLIRLGRGKHTHVLTDEGALCGSAGEPRWTTARTLTCYRCLKLYAMRYFRVVPRDLDSLKRRLHLMVPGGRDGDLVGDVRVSPWGRDGHPDFPPGPIEHPTQPTRWRD